MDDGQASPTAKSEAHDLSTASPHTTVGDGGPNGRNGGAEKGDADGAEGGQPKAKRRRVAVACKSCRYRKSRVSGSMIALAISQRATSGLPLCLCAS